MIDPVHPVLFRQMLVSTADTGGSLDVPGPEGMVQFRRMDPHGVIMVFEGKQLSIQKADVPIMAKYFAAAALLLGEEL